VGSSKDPALTDSNPVPVDDGKRRKRNIIDLDVKEQNGRKESRKLFQEL